MTQDLRQLFDYQRFEKNEKLQAMIDATEDMYLKKKELEDEDMALVAGGIGKNLKDEKNTGHKTPSL